MDVEGKIHPNIILKAVTSHIVFFALKDAFIPSQTVRGGNKSSFFCVPPRMVVKGLNNQSLYIILYPAVLVDADIMSC